MYNVQVGDAGSGYLPKVWYKVWGHAEQDWRGEREQVEGAPLRVYNGPPRLRRPAKLPPVEWVTPDIVTNVQELAAKYCSKEEQEWFGFILRDKRLLNPRYLHWAGLEGEGNLPGRPGHFACRDLAGKVWEVKVRVLDQLPDDLWGVPADRSQRIADEYKLSEAERLRMPRVSFSNTGSAPAHPAWTGCQLQSDQEVVNLFCLHSANQSFLLL